MMEIGGSTLRRRWFLMLSLLTILGGVSLGLAIWRLVKYYQIHSSDCGCGDFGFIGWIIVSAFLTAICLALTIIMISGLVVRPAQIEQEIQMYQEENQKIEASVDTAVKSYMEHEEKVFDMLDGSDSVTTLLMRFPELTSDELVKKQIEIYQSNNEKIKSLKEEKIGLSTKRFLVYFGH